MFNPEPSFWLLWFTNTLCSSSKLTRVFPRCAWQKSHRGKDRISCAIQRNFRKCLYKPPTWCSNYKYLSNGNNLANNKGEQWKYHDSNRHLLPASVDLHTSTTIKKSLKKTIMYKWFFLPGTCTNDIFHVFKIQVNRSHSVMIWFGSLTQ